MSTPSPLQGVTWPLWLVFLCLTPSFLRLLSLAPFSSPCASLSLFLNGMKTQSTGQDPLKVSQSNIAPVGVGYGLYLLRI